MALFRATSNPQATLKLEAAHRKLRDVLGSGRRVAKADGPLALRRGAIREAVIEVLMQADWALAPLEIRRRAAHRLGRPVRRHTIDTCLAKVVVDPESPIAKVGPACYASVADAIDIMPSGGELQERVLGTAPGPMRPAEVWAAVEINGGAVSYDAVASFLSFAARHPLLPVERVKRGWYRLSVCAG